MKRHEGFSNTKAWRNMKVFQHEGMKGHEGFQHEDMKEHEGLQHEGMEEHEDFLT